MTNNHYHQFMPPGFTGQPAEVEASVPGHDHLVKLILNKAKLGQAHAVLHAVGAEDSDLHAECLAKFEQNELDIDRAFHAIWN